MLAKSRRGERGHSEANENQRGESRTSFVRSILIRDRARLQRRRAKRDRGSSRHVPPGRIAAVPPIELHPGFTHQRRALYDRMDMRCRLTKGNFRHRRRPRNSLRWSHNSVSEHRHNCERDTVHGGATAFQKLVSESGLAELKSTWTRSRFKPENCTSD